MPPASPSPTVLAAPPQCAGDKLVRSCGVAFAVLCFAHRAFCGTLILARLVADMVRDIPLAAAQRSALQPRP